MTVHYRWKTIQTGCQAVVTQRWPWPLNRDDHLKEEKNTSVKEKKIGDFDNWPLNTGWPLNMVLLNMGSTVSWIQQQWQVFVTSWKILTLHNDISSYCLFLSHSIACDANIFSCIIPVTTEDFQLFGVRQGNPRFFPSYLRFRKPRGITTQIQRSWRVNSYILWHICKLDRN